MDKELDFVCNDGVFVLQYDVVNCKSDKSYERQFGSAELWGAGLLVSVSGYVYDERSPVLRCCPGQVLSGEIVCRLDNKCQWEPILDSLGDSPKTLKTLLATLDLEGRGCLSPADLLEVAMLNSVIDYYELLRLARSVSLPNG